MRKQHNKRCGYIRSYTYVHTFHDMWCDVRRKLHNGSTVILIPCICVRRYNPENNEELEDNAWKGYYDKMPLHVMELFAAFISSPLCRIPFMLSHCCMIYPILNSIYCTLLYDVQKHTATGSVRVKKV